MAHPRAQLRAAAVAALTGLATTGSRVFVDREYTMQPAELPCLHVSTSEATDTSGPFADGVQRTVNLQVRLLAKTTGAMSDLLDTMASEVEVALVPGLTVGGRLVLPEGFTASAPNLAVNGDQPVGEVEMAFTFQLFSPASSLATVF